MTGLTADQIRHGVKRGLRPVPAPTPQPEQQGRWRCTLCRWPTWHTGTYADWMQHYLAEHHGRTQDAHRQ